MSGWIKLHRSIIDHWLYTEKRVYSRFEAWNDILLTVNYSQAKTIIKGKIYIIKRGESILSLESWSKRWNWDKSKVRRFLTLLQTDGMIVVKGDSITTHLIVCKYDSYQGDRHADETPTKRKRNADDIQTTLIEEEEEDKKNKEEKEIPLFSEFFEYVKTFEQYDIKYDYSIQAKYNSWVDNKWRDGKNNDIENWKNKIRNTFAYLKIIENPNKPHYINSLPR
jgi:hypothetical protein